MLTMRWEHSDNGTLTCSWHKEQSTQNPVTTAFVDINDVATAHIAPSPITTDILPRKFGTPKTLGASIASLFVFGITLGMYYV